MTLRRPGRRVLAGLAAAVLVLAAVVAVIAVASQPGADQRPEPAHRRRRRPARQPARGARRHVLHARRAPAGCPRSCSRTGSARRRTRSGRRRSSWPGPGSPCSPGRRAASGASTGQIALDSPDYEVKDVEQLVSWLARQPRVLLDHPGDPRVGIAGASYGGGIALLAAAYDHRIDAIVPQITWNNLATALFPNGAGGGPLDGVFKKQWAGLLFTQGSVGLRHGRRGAQSGSRSGSGSRPGPRQSPGSTSRDRPGGRVRPVPAQHLRHLPAVGRAGRATPQAVSLLMPSSPASVASRIDVPTLLIQGEHDSLFGLDQADANYQAIRRNGAPVDMVWFAGGHDGGDQETGPGERADRAVVRPLAEAAEPAAARHRQRRHVRASLHRAARVRGDPATGLRPVQRAGDRSASPPPRATPACGGTRQTLLSACSGPPQTIIQPGRRRARRRSRSSPASARSGRRLGSRLRHARPERGLRRPRR